MKVNISHKKTISITIPTVKPILSEVPKFVPQSLISDDENNGLTTGTDGLLYVNDTKELDIDFMSLINNTLHAGL